MSSTRVTLPRSYYSFLSHPGIKIQDGRDCIKVSLYREENRLPIHCQFEHCKATLLSALQSLKLVSDTPLDDKDKNKLVKAIAEPLSDYLRFNAQEHFYKIYFLNTMAWMLLLSLVAIVVLSGLAIPFTSALYLMMLVPVIAACFGLITGTLSNDVSASNQLEITYKKLIAAIERVNNKIEKKREVVKERKLEVITEESSVYSLEMPNNTDESKYGSLYTTSQLKPLDSHTTEAETNVSLSATP